MTDKPLILLTNDDGIRSPGLLAVAEAVCDLGDILIVAPATQQTGMGRGAPPIVDGMIETYPFHLDRCNVTAYAINGTPAQAVFYGVLSIAPRRPALVISGINHGENVGTSVTLSGTVGAALEASALGIPALAVSFEVEPRFYYNHSMGLDWRAPAYFTRYFAQAMLAARMPDDVDILKVDVPSSATEQTPWRIARQSRQPYWQAELAETRQGPGPLQLLTENIRIDWERTEPDSDVHAVARERVVSVVPISKDLTSRTDLTALGQLLRDDPAE